MRKLTTAIVTAALLLSLSTAAMASHDTSVAITSPANAATLPASTTSVIVSGTAVPTVNDILVTLKTTAGVVVGTQEIKGGMDKDDDDWDGNWATAAPFTVQAGESYEVTAVARHGGGTSSAAHTFRVDTRGDDPEVKEDCDNDGWIDYRFKNHGQCVRFVAAGKDSR